ncbi:replication protein [Olleya sp. AH-315-K02]|nr:replication protein [bacterium AH-315-P13]MBN4057916.1 replication protein [Olleya sp. AH-315-K02]
MRYQQTTQVPNEVFDTFLPGLTGAEFKIFMIIIRQTYGWRKKRDRMNYSQFITKTNLSRRVIADSIQSLTKKHLIEITDYHGVKLNTPELRKGKLSIYFSACLTSYAQNNTNLGNKQRIDRQKLSYNKTNVTKLNRQKIILNQGHKKITDKERIQQILFKQSNTKKE